MSTKKLKKLYNISVWPEYKLNFWGVPKSGNSAIKVALAKLNVNDSKFDLFWVHDVNNVTYVDRHTALSNGYKNFTVIRHPYERFISLYKDLGIKRPIIETNNIDEFIDYVVQTTDLKCNPHFKSTSYYITENDNVLVDDVINLKNAGEYLSKYGLTLNIVNNIKNLKIELTTKQKQSIYQRYKKDFELF